MCSSVVSEYYLTALSEYVSRFTHDWGGFCSSDLHNRPGTAIYFMGIIDILQDYNLRKQLEHGIKSLQYDGVRSTPHT